MQIAQRVQRIAASQSLAMAARAKAMKAAGIDVISMSLGEPDMDTPEHIRRAAQEAIDNHWSHYGPVAGIPSLREAIAAAQNAQEERLSGSAIRGLGVRFEAEDVIVSVGAKMAIYNAIQTMINPGDEVVIPMPSWVSYTDMVKVAGGEVVAVQTKYENRYCMMAEELRAALTEKTRMLILCSPNNPTGSVYSYEELKAIVAVLREYPQVVVLSDEIYNALVYSDEENKNIQNTACADINIDKKNTHSTPAMSDGPRGLERNHPQALASELAAPVDANTPNLLPDEQHVECLQKFVVPPCENDKNIVCSMAFFAEIADRLIIVNGVSKAYAMTGWRIGWLMSKDKAFIEACTRLQGQQVTCATMVAQKAAQAALTGSRECVEQMRQVFAERRELICRLAAEIPGFRFEKPQGAFYLFPNISTLFGKFEIGDLRLEIDNADDLVEYLLEEAHVAVVSGSAFGCPECIRLSYAISTEEIAEAMRRIQVAITRIVNKQK